MVNVFNSFFNYSLCFAGSVLVVGLAVFIGVKLRKNKDQNNKEL